MKGKRILKVLDITGHAIYIITAYVLAIYKEPIFLVVGLAIVICTQTLLGYIHSKKNPDKKAFKKRIPAIIVSLVALVVIYFFLYNMEVS